MRSRASRGVLLAVVFMMALPALAELAGRVTALVPAAARNRVATRAQEALEWNDQLTTDSSGRLRASLTDGSVLSLGAATELRVVKHDAASQQTELELAYGRLRSMVTPLRGVHRTFQVKTPVASVGVIGTDFFLEASASALRVVCFSGTVRVTAVADPARSYTVAAGQLLELDAQGTGTVQRATSAAIRDALDRTAIASELDLAPRTRLSATLTRTLDDKDATVGTPVVARLSREIRLGDAVVVPKGTELLGAVTEVQRRDGTHAMAQLGVAFTQMRLPGGRTMNFRAVIEGIEVPSGLKMDEDESAESTFGEARADRTGSRPPTGLAAPRPPIPTARSSVGTIPPVRDPIRLEEPPVALRRTPVPSPGTPAVQPKIAEQGSGAVFKSSRGIHLASGTTLALRTLEP